MATGQAAAEAEALDSTIHATQPRLELEGSSCVLVDDRLATGATMEAAIDWARRGGARRVVVAVPVGAPTSVAGLESLADDVVCLETPALFMAVGLHYEDFSQVSNHEVIALLDDARAEHPHRQT